jgi:hypothetical protein
MRLNAVRISNSYFAELPFRFLTLFAQVLAPNGKLISPDEAFGEGGLFDKDVEEKTRLAFKALSHEIILLVVKKMYKQKFFLKSLYGFTYIFMDALKRLI